jgi:MFS family permease
MSPVYAAALVVLCEGLVLWAVFPIMSYYCAELGGGPASVGLLFALLSAPRVVFNPIFARLSERFGRRPLMAVASLGTMAGSIGWALAPNIAWLAVSRAVAGVFGAQAALSSAVVADVTAPEKRSAAMGLVGAAFGLSMIFGPLLGGWVTHLASHGMVGWVGAALQGLSVLTVIFLLSETRPADPDSGECGPPRPALRTLARVPHVTPLLLVALCSALSVAQITTTFSLLAEREYQFSEAEAGLAFALFGLIGTLVQGSVIRMLNPRFGDRKLAVAGMAIVVVSAAAIALDPPRWALWVCMGLIGAGVALSTPTVAALLSRCVGPDRHGTLLGMHQGVLALGRGASAPVAGVLFAQLGPAAPYVAAAGVALVGGTLLLPLTGVACEPAKPPPPVGIP